MVGTCYKLALNLLVVPIAYKVDRNDQGQSFYVITHYPRAIAGPPSLLELLLQSISSSYAGRICSITPNSRDY
jgi:hypothetical protein